MIHEKPKRLSLRPVAGVVICVTSIAVFIGRGGAWRTAGFILVALLAAAVLAYRFFTARVARARQPDPESTLKL
jgi:hypothetical protein